MADDRLRVVFFGTSDFAVPVLARLVSDPDFVVSAVVTQPDRPGGRGLRQRNTPVKAAASAYSLPVLQPERIRTPALEEQIRAMRPDFLVVAAYGRILPPSLLKIPSVAPVNVHASLLPLYRGAAPIHRALLDGATETGVTTMLMNEGMDEGDILLQRRVSVPPLMNAGELGALMADIGSDLLVKTLRGLLRGEIKARPQDASRATYAPPIVEEDRPVRWNESAIRCQNRVRALAPQPGAYALFRGRRVKTLEAVSGEQHALQPPGTVIAVTRNEVEVATGEGGLRLRTVQPEGSRKMSAGDWARGARIVSGDMFDVWSDT